jgi:hypothetical protein
MYAGYVFQETASAQVGLTEYTVTALEAVTPEEVAADVKHVVTELKLPFKALETGFGVEEADLPQARKAPYGWNPRPRPPATTSP